MQSHPCVPSAYIFQASEACAVDIWFLQYVISLNDAVHTASVHQFEGRFSYKISITNTPSRQEQI
jgi:hypothetical protein